MIARRLFNHPAATWPTADWRSPFFELERMNRRMNHLSNVLMGKPFMGYSPARIFPPVNISEDTDHYYLRAELPGLGAEDIDIEINKNNLSISGERAFESTAEGKKYHRRERDAGKFSRVLELPGDIDAEHVSAKMNNGILTVSIPKAEAAKPRQITVH